MATIGLCMIVKNEAHVIQRCLASAARLLDYILIVDTGSIDGTQALIADFLQRNHIPGEVIPQPWQNFAYNRSFALQQLREHNEIDYALMIDADEIMVFADNFDVAAFKHDLQHDLYDVQTRYGGCVYLRPQLCSNRLAFHYKGVLHEYLDVEHIQTRSTINGFYNYPIQDSARAQNPRKFHDDATTLAAAIAVEKDPFLVSRYTFYLAQSYRDAGELQPALTAYLSRAQQGFWQEEVYISLLNATRLKARLGFSEAEQLQAFMAAYENLPTRLEALHDAIRVCRSHGHYQHAYLLAKHGLSLTPPVQGLFIEPWIADYGLLDEFSIVAYWSGHYQESLAACTQLLTEAKIPPDYQQRIQDNADFARVKITSGSV